MQRNRKNFGWAVVAAMLLVQTVSSGLGFYNMSVYMIELANALSQPLAVLSVAVSIFFVAGGLTGLYVARLIDRVPIRAIMLAGALLSGMALAAVGQASQVWHIYALFALFGVGNTGVSLVVATTLITRWFPGPNRSVALSVASTGLSLGGVTLTPLTAYLFNSLGVSATMPWLGLAFVVLIVPVVLTLVHMPADAPAPDPSVDHKATYRAALRQRFFILLCLGYVLCMLAQVGGIAHIYGRVLQLGDYASAAMAVQVLSISSILGRFAGGYLASRIAIRTFTLVALAVQIAGLLMLAGAVQVWVAIVAAGVFGASVGNLLMSQPLWLAQAYSGSVYPRMFAMANALSVLGVAAGPLVMGLLADQVDYLAAYGVAGLVSLVAAGVFFFARTPTAGTDVALASQTQ